MSAPAGFLTQCAEWLVATNPSVADLKQARKACTIVEGDAVAARKVIDQHLPKTDCGCSDDAYLCRQPGCPRAEILGIFEAKPSLADLVDMFPDDEPVSQARAS